MEQMRKLTAEEMQTTSGGEAITLTAIMAILAISIVVVICYRFFVSEEGSVSLPGGFKFEWGD